MYERESRKGEEKGLYDHTQEIQVGELERLTSVGVERIITACHRPKYGPNYLITVIQLLELSKWQGCHQVLNSNLSHTREANELSNQWHIL